MDEITIIRLNVRGGYGIGWMRFINHRVFFRTDDPDVL